MEGFGMVEFLAENYYHHSGLLCYTTGFLILFVIYKVWKAGGLKRPKKKGGKDEQGGKT